jgi:hypothetical protein
MEPDGSVHIMTDEEIELMKKLNPKAFEQSAYGTTYQGEAPEIPKPPPLGVPKQAQWRKSPANSGVLTFLI